MTKRLRFPEAPDSIEKGANLALLLGDDAIDCLAHNLRITWPEFRAAAFRKAARAAVEGHGIMQRGVRLAEVMREFLPAPFEAAADILVRSLGPAHNETSGHGLAPFFYLPHGNFVALYGIDRRLNAGRDPFPISMNALREITRRSTAEFAIRPFLVEEPERTLRQLLAWTNDECPHVRRLCSEGTRPRLPWGMRLKAFVADPRPALPILEALKDDADLYVRRSVANHVGDIAKDHPELAFELCRSWLNGAGAERLWVIRHALRHPAKKGVETARGIRRLAGGKR